MRNCAVHSCLRRTPLPPSIYCLDRRQYRASFGIWSVPDVPSFLTEFPRSADLTVGRLVKPLSDPVPSIRFGVRLGRAQNQSSGLELPVAESSNEWATDEVPCTGVTLELSLFDHTLGVPLPGGSSNIAPPLRSADTTRRGESRLLIISTLCSVRSVDGVMDRDFLLELLSANAIIGVHLSRLAEEVRSSSDHT